MRIVVWGSGIVESRMLWERAESTLEAQHLAETLSIAWEDIEGLDRWSVEIECPDPDDVLRSRRPPVTTPCSAGRPLRRRSRPPGS
jgi:hypothetical protein